jgi:hypothetical protein
LGFSPALTGVYLAALGLLRLYPATTPTCDHALTPPLRIFGSSMVEVTSDRAFALRSKAEPDLRASLVFLRRHFGDVADSLEPYVHPGALFASAYDACRGEAQVLVDPSRAMARVNERWVTFALSDLAAPGVRLVHGGAAPPKVAPVAGDKAEPVPSKEE